MIEPLEEVDMVETAQQAGRLRLEFEHLLAKGQPEDYAADLRDAIAALDRRFPDAEEEGLISTEDELGGLGRELRQHRQGRRRESGIDATEAARRRRQRDHAGSGSGSRGSSPKGGRRRASSGTARRSSSSSSRGGGFTRRAANASGAAQLATSTTDLVIGGLRVALGLALVYLLLSPRGSKGFSGVLNAVSSLVSAFIYPVDPLNPGKKATTPSTAGGVPVLQPGEKVADYDKRLQQYLLSNPNAAAPKATSGAGVLGAPNLGGFPQLVTGTAPTTRSVISDRQTGGTI